MIDKITVDEILDAAVKKILDAALNLIQKDGHQFGTRPCQTCRAVSALAGRPFGCDLLAKRAANK